MSEVDPNVLAQLHRIHAAVNHGTVDKDTINDALRVIHDLLSGVAYEDTPEVTEGSVEGVEGGGEAPPVRKPPRKKR